MNHQYTQKDYLLVLSHSVILAVAVGVFTWMNVNVFEALLVPVALAITQITLGKNTDILSKFYASGVMVILVVMICYSDIITHSYMYAMWKFLTVIVLDGLFTFVNMFFTESSKKVTMEVEVHSENSTDNDTI